MTKPVEFIKKAFELPCHKCEGTGILKGPLGYTSKGLQKKRQKCSVCNGTGKWIEDNYHLIATTPDGQRIAFQTEGFS